MHALLMFPVVLGFAACDDEEPTSPEGATLVEAENGIIHVIDPVLPP